MNAAALKRWFKTKFAIPVRVKTGSTTHSDPWIQVWITPEEKGKFHDPLVYRHRFPPELGKMCMGIVYKGHDTLSTQSWGGNITSTSLAMKASQWEELLASS